MCPAPECTRVLSLRATVSMSQSGKRASYAVTSYTKSTVLQFKSLIDLRTHLAAVKTEDPFAFQIERDSSLAYSLSSSHVSWIKKGEVDTSRLRPPNVLLTSTLHFRLPTPLRPAWNRVVGGSYAIDSRSGSSHSRYRGCLSFLSAFSFI